MEVSLSDTIAQLLDLNKDGRAAPATTTETVEEARERTEFIILHLSKMEDPSASGEEFASLYLPSLVRSFLALGTTLKGTPLSHETHISYVRVFGLLVVNSASSLPRFVRDFPDEASTFFLKIVDTVIDLTDGIINVMKDHDIPSASGAVANILELLCHLSTILSEHLPAALPLPSLPPTSRRSLRSLANRLRKRELPEIEAALITHTGVPANIICTVLQCVSEDKMPRESHGVPLVWQTCEHRVAAGTSEEDSTCTKMQEGEEMMVCSRCLAVRYCSKEHQKVDWKRHKRVCFKLSW